MGCISTLTLKLPAAENGAGPEVCWITTARNGSCSVLALRTRRSARLATALVRRNIAFKDCALFRPANAWKRSSCQTPVTRVVMIEAKGAGSSLCVSLWRSRFGATPRIRKTRRVGGSCDPVTYVTGCPASASAIASSRGSGCVPGLTTRYRSFVRDELCGPLRMLNAPSPQEPAPPSQFLRGFRSRRPATSSRRTTGRVGRCLPTRGSSGRSPATVR